MAYLTTIILPVTSKNSTFFTNSISAVGASNVLFSLNGFTSAAQLQYLQVYDSADGNISAASLESTNIIGANSNFSLDFGRGLVLDNGILVVLSKTPKVYTPTDNSAWFIMSYY
jgi:hypothetical protein